MADGLNRDAGIAALQGGYDLRGNLTGDGTRSFTYDTENRLISVAGPVTAGLSYDPAGRLRQTTINGVTTQFLYAGPDLIAEMDSAGAILRRYIHGPGVNNPLVWIEGATMAASGVRYLYKDRLGSITSWTNAAGVVQATFAYGPYGEPKAWSGSRFGYTGQVALSELGLYHYHARVYDPVTGRFLQTDPTGYDDGPNMYIYVGGDPINMVDPLGMAAADGIEEIVITASRKPSFDIVDSFKEFFKDIKTLKKISSYISRRIFGKKKKAPQAQQTPPNKGNSVEVAEMVYNCPTGVYSQVSGGGSGTLAAGVFGVNVSAVWGSTIPPGNNVLGQQWFVNVQITPMLGLGAFAGYGIQGSGGVNSTVFPTGFSGGFQGWTGDLEGGYGPLSGGVSGSIARDSGNVSIPIGKVGQGLGIWGGAGPSFGATMATSPNCRSN